MNNILESATESIRKQSVPIDLLDDSGDIAFQEWEKKEKYQKLTQKDIDKIIELVPEDWIQLILYKNEKGLSTTILFKELFLLCQRTGIKWDWQPYHYGPHSNEVKKGLGELETKEIISLEIKPSHKQRIYKLHILKKKDYAEKLWNILPNSFKEVINNIVKDFAGKSYEDVIHYVYSAYPEFMPPIKQ